MTDELVQLDAPIGLQYANIIGLVPNIIDVFYRWRIELHFGDEFFWFGSDIREDTFVGYGSVMYDLSTKKKIGSLMFADASSDDNEPDLDIVTNENLSEIDAALEKWYRVDPELNVQEWKSLYFCGKKQKTLCSEFTEFSDETLWKNECVRLKVEEKKYVMIATYVADQEERLRRFTYGQIQAVIGQIEEGL